MVKNIRGFAFFIVGLALFATTTQSGHGKGLPLIELPVKPPAPAMQLQEYEGEAFDLKKYLGRIVVVNFLGDMVRTMSKRDAGFRGRVEDASKRRCLVGRG